MVLPASLVVFALFGCVISKSGYDHDCKSGHGGSKQYGYGSYYRSRHSQFDTYNQRHDGHGYWDASSWSSWGSGGSGHTGSGFRHTGSGSGSGSWLLGVVGQSIGSLLDAPPQPLPPYLGCFSNENQGMLTDDYYPNDRMHIRLCVSRCNGRLYRLLGVHNTSCYCGNSYDTDLHVTVADSECNIICPGNVSQSCGGIARLSVYRLR